MRFPFISLFVSLLMLFSQAISALSITSSFTGAWYDPVTEGQGFSIEVVDTNSGKTLVMYWYTFDPDGKPLWLLGTSVIKDTASVELDLYEMKGGVFGAGFDTNNIVTELWGTITLDFDSCDAGVASYAAEKERFGTGRINLARITNVFAEKCTGGVSDDTPQDGSPIEIVEYLNNTGAFAGSSAKSDYEQRADRTEFTITTRDLPVGPFDLLVDGVFRGQFQSSSTPIGNEGRIRFRSPIEEGKLLMDFDPRNKRVEIKQGSLVFLSSVMSQEDNTPDVIPPGTPEFGNAEYVLVMDNIAAPASAHGDAELELRSDRVQFEVELEDVEIGTYDLYVGNIHRGMLVNQGLEGELDAKVEFRYPVESGKETLDFDPRGREVRVELDGVVVFSGQFTEFPQTEFNDEDEDGDDEEPPVDEVEVSVVLDNISASQESSAEAKYHQEEDRSDFQVELESVSSGTYVLIVSGVEQGTIVVGDEESSSVITFSTDQEEGEFVLDFDPLGQEIRIEQQGVILFSGVLPEQ